MELFFTCFRFFLGIVSIVLMALFMWGLKALMVGMGRDFSIGFVAGMWLLFAVLWGHHKLTGKNCFTEN
jgi:hypothetical protein